MRAWIAGAIFVIVLLIAFAVFALHITESSPPKEPVATTTPITNVSASDSYHADVHTIKGVATVQTACTPLIATSSVIAGTTTVVRIDLSATPDTGVCLELPTPVSFSITADATSTADVEIYANGKFATTTP